MSSKKRKSKAGSEKGSKSKKPKDEKPPKYESATEEKKEESNLPDMYFTMMHASYSEPNEVAIQHTIRSPKCHASLESALNENKQFCCELMFLFDDLVTRSEAMRFRLRPEWETDPEKIRLEICQLIAPRLGGGVLDVGGDLLQLMPDGTFKAHQVPGINYRPENDVVS